MSTTRTYLAHGVFGLLLGAALSCIGFSDYTELHRMFTFAELRMFLSFAGAFALCVLGFAMLRRWQRMPTVRIHKGTIPGALLFGIGWVLSAGCPAIPLVQLGEGQLPALATLLGLLCGTLAYRELHRRVLRWERGACGD